MPETMESGQKSLRIKIISIGVAECGKVSYKSSQIVLLLDHGIH